MIKSETQQYVDRIAQRNRVEREMLLFSCSDARLIPQQSEKEKQDFDACAILDSLGVRRENALQDWHFCDTRSFWRLITPEIKFSINTDNKSFSVCHNEKTIFYVAVITRDAHKFKIVDTIEKLEAIQPVLQSQVLICKCKTCGLPTVSCSLSCGFFHIFHLFIFLFKLPQVDFCAQCFKE